MRTLVAILLIGLASACGSEDDKCCKVCDQGKACGDSCIAQNQTCNAGAGCACNK